MTIRYGDDASTVQPVQLDAFFDGWTVRPPPALAVGALAGADIVFLAWEGDRLVGFVTAITDGALAASIPFLEVSPDRRGQGIGTELMRLVTERLAHLYAIDLACDEALVPFYERLGFERVRGMAVRRPERLS